MEVSLFSTPKEDLYTVFIGMSNDGQHYEIKAHVNPLVFWLWFGAGMMLMMPMYNCVIPFFGTLLSGWAGAAVYLLLAAAWVYAAWAMYQLKHTGWWLVVIALAVFTISNLMTFSRVDMTEMYRVMGYPEAQIREIERFNVFKDGALIFWSVIWVLPVFGYLVYIRRFLTNSHGVGQSAGEL